MKLCDSAIEEDSTIKPVTKAELYYYKYEYAKLVAMGIMADQVDRQSFLCFYRRRWYRMSVLRRAPFIEKECKDLERYKRDLKEKKDMMNSSAAVE